MSTVKTEVKPKMLAPLLSSSLSLFLSTSLLSPSLFSLYLSLLSLPLAFSLATKFEKWEVFEFTEMSQVMTGVDPNTLAPLRSLSFSLLLYLSLSLSPNLNNGRYWNSQK
jgi:hypothetical protein